MDDLFESLAKLLFCSTYMETREDRRLGIDRDISQGTEKWMIYLKLLFCSTYMKTRDDGRLEILGKDIMKNR